MSKLLYEADGGVIALGGGAVCVGAGSRGARSPRRRLAAGIGGGGLAAGGGQRPASGPGPCHFEALHAERQPIYAELADAILPPGDEELVARALPSLIGLRELPHGTRMAWASSDSGEYPAYVGEGLLAAGLLAA